MDHSLSGANTCILLVTSTQALRDAVADALQRARIPHRLFWVAELDLASTRATDLLPGIILLDAGLATGGISGAVRDLSRSVPTASVLILADLESLEVARAGVLAGARGFISLPLRSEELVAVLRQVLNRPGPAFQAAASGRANSRVVTFCAPKGGTGRTTLAINTAICLYELERQPVVLVDADYAAPALDVALNLREEERNVFDLLPKIAQLDQDLVESFLVHHPSGIDLLLAPPPSTLPALLTVPQVQQILAWLRRSFRWVVIDLGLPLDETAGAFLDSADQILMSIMPEMIGLHNASSMLRQLQARGYPPDKLWPILNRANLSGGLKVRDVEARLGAAIRYTIPNDQNLATESINRGVPLVLGRRRSLVARACQALARELRAAAAPGAAAVADRQQVRVEPAAREEAPVVSTLTGPEPAELPDVPALEIPPAMPADAPEEWMDVGIEDGWAEAAGWESAGPGESVAPAPDQAPPEPAVGEPAEPLLAAPEASAAWSAAVDTEPAAPEARPAETGLTPKQAASEAPAAPEAWFAGEAGLTPEQAASEAPAAVEALPAETGLTPEQAENEAPVAPEAWFAGEAGVTEAPGPEPAETPPASIDREAIIGTAEAPAREPDQMLVPTPEQPTETPADEREAPAELSVPGDAVGTAASEEPGAPPAVPRFADVSPENVPGDTTAGFRAVPIGPEPPAALPEPVEPIRAPDLPAAATADQPSVAEGPEPGQERAAEPLAPAEEAPAPPAEALPGEAPAALSELPEPEQPITGPSIEPSAPLVAAATADQPSVAAEPEPGQELAAGPLVPAEEAPAPPAEAVPGEVPAAPPEPEQPVAAPDRPSEPLADVPAWTPGPLPPEPAADEPEWPSAVVFARQPVNGSHPAAPAAPPAQDVTPAPAELPLEHNVALPPRPGPGAPLAPIAQPPSVARRLAAPVWMGIALAVLTLAVIGLLAALYLQNQSGAQVAANPTQPPAAGSGPVALRPSQDLTPTAVPASPQPAASQAVAALAATTPTATPTATTAPTATPEPSATPAPTIAPTLTPEPTSAPTATPPPTSAPSATPLPTSLPTSTPAPLPSATRRPAIARPLRPATARPSPTVIKVPVASQPTRMAISAPALAEPMFGSHLAGKVHFEWQPTGPLPTGAAYEVVWWNEGENPDNARGIVPPTPGNGADANLDVIYDSHQITNNYVHWTVLIVQTQPYQRLTQPRGSEQRLMVYDPTVPHGW